MKKRMMALAMAAAMVLGACGGSQPAATTAAPAATEAAKTEAAKAEETKAEETKAEETKAEAAASEKGGMEGGTALNFTTGGDQGTYYGFGGVLAGKVGETTSTTVTAITSGGSAANIEALDAGDAQLGFVQSDVMAYAHDGIRLFEETGAVDTFSTVAALYMEQVQIVTLDENIKSVADLKGKNVSIGAAGSGVYFNAIDVLEAYGLTERDVNPTYQSFGDSADALQSGKLDAAFVVAGAPTSAISGLAATTDIYLIGLDDEHINKLIQKNPAYSKEVISSKTYNTVSDIDTVAVGAVLLANDDVSEDDVYKIISGIYENMDAITKAHSKGAELNLITASSVKSVPYHKGAAKYYSEKGITVPTK